MSKHEFKWAPDLPFMEVRRFIAERLRSENASPELDAEVAKFLDKPVGPRYTLNLSAAVSLIPEGWWWHLSHLEAEVIPTVDVPGAPISNSSRYDFYGKPIGYSAICWERKDLPIALCEALLKARYDLPDAFVVNASALDDQKYAFRMQRYSHRSREMREKMSKPSRFNRLRNAWYAAWYSYTDDGL